MSEQLDQLFQDLQEKLSEIGDEVKDQISNIRRGIDESVDQDIKEIFNEDISVSVGWFGKIDVHCLNFSKEFDLSDVLFETIAEYDNDEHFTMTKENKIFVTGAEIKESYAKMFEELAVKIRSLKNP